MIARKFNQDIFYIENDTYDKIDIDSTSIPEKIVAAIFIDGSVTETSTNDTWW